MSVERSQDEGERYGISEARGGRDEGSALSIDEVDWLHFF